MELNSLSTTSRGFRIFGAAGGDYCGYSISSVGDVNGDDIDDLIVGAYLAEPVPGRFGAGISYVIFGRDVAGVHRPMYRAAHP